MICENIERSGRDMYDALRLERELRAAGLPVFATDEPMDAQAPEAGHHLGAAEKQGMAEFFRYNLKAQMWEGLKQYTIAGYNIGLCPYGYFEDRTVHPNPMKAGMGATRARLVPDPERGPWVTKMFEWRVFEHAGLQRHRPAADRTRRAVAGRRPIGLAAGTTSCASPNTPARSCSVAAATLAMPATPGPAESAVRAA